jgi:hypothetical protein
MHCYVQYSFNVFLLLLHLFLCVFYMIFMFVLSKADICRIAIKFLLDLDINMCIWLSVYGIFSILFYRNGSFKLTIEWQILPWLLCFFIWFAQKLAFTLSDVYSCTFEHEHRLCNYQIVDNYSDNNSCEPAYTWKRRGGKNDLHGLVDHTYGDISGKVK